MPKISSKLKRSHPLQRRRQMQVGRLNTGAVAENWRLLKRSVVNLARSQVYHTERPLRLQHVRRDAAHRAGLSATADPCIVSQSRSCYRFCWMLILTSFTEILVGPPSHIEDPTTKFLWGPDPQTHRPARDRRLWPISSIKQYTLERFYECRPVRLRLHDTTGCKTGWTTDCIV